jgi:hypothetical protein
MDAEKALGPVQAKAKHFSLRAFVNMSIWKRMYQLV